jgi:hypothetical protein
VLLLGLGCGVTVGVLTYFDGSNTRAAILAGLTSTGGSIVFLHKEVK